MFLTIFFFLNKTNLLIKSFHAGYIQFNMARNVMLSAARPIIDIDTATPHMRLSVQFLGRLSNKTSKLQVTLNIATSLVNYR